MKKKLLYTNPHLRSAKKFREGVIRNVLSSTAVEIGKVPKALQKKIESYDFKSFPLVKFKQTSLFA